MDFQELQGFLIAIAVILAVVGVIVFVLIRVFAPHLADQVPSDVVKKLIDFNITLLQAGLGRAAETEEEWDDQFYIAGLRLLGWRVTGNKDTGYEVLPPIEV